MSRLSEYKSELVQTTTCELTLLKKGHLKCANEILKYRRAGTWIAHLIDCLLEEDDYDEEMVNYFMEQVKELTRRIAVNRCIEIYC